MRWFHGMMLSGKLQQAIRQVTLREKGEILFPDNACTKTDWPILEVLQGKHPDTQVPDLEGNLSSSTLEVYVEVPEVVSLDFLADNVAIMAKRMLGWSGGCGQRWWRSTTGYFSSGAAQSCCRRSWWSGRTGSPTLPPLGLTLRHHGLPACHAGHVPRGSAGGDQGDPLSAPGQAHPMGHGRIGKAHLWQPPNMRRPRDGHIGGHACIAPAV